MSPQSQSPVTENCSTISHYWIHHGRTPPLTTTRPSVFYFHHSIDLPSCAFAAINEPPIPSPENCWTRSTSMDPSMEISHHWQPTTRLSVGLTFSTSATVLTFHLAFLSLTASAFHKDTSQLIQAVILVGKWQGRPNQILQWLNVKNSRSNQ